jgi:hypothetical protein
MSGVSRFTNNAGESARFASTDQYDPSKLARTSSQGLVWIYPSTARID